jgi:hypothetical protein
MSFYTGKSLNKAHNSTGFINIKAEESGRLFYNFSVDSQLGYDIFYLKRAKYSDPTLFRTIEEISGPNTSAIGSMYLDKNDVVQLIYTKDSNNSSVIDEAKIHSLNLFCSGVFKDSQPKVAFLSFFDNVNTSLVPPSQFFITDIGSTCFTVNWNQVLGASSYRIDVSTGFNFSTFVNNYNNRNVTTAQQKVTGLNLNTNYYIRVKSVSAGSISQNSNSIVQNTMIGYGEPIGLQNVLFPSGFIRAVASGHNNNFFIGGEFTGIGNATRTRVASILNNGNIDPDFVTTGPNNSIQTMLYSPQHTGLYIGGFFTSIDGVTRSGIARLAINQPGKINGELDTSFNAQLAIWSSLVKVTSIAQQSDGKLLVGGLFKINNRLENNFVRLNSDGSYDTSFTSPLPGSSIDTICIQPDQKILIGGSFAFLAVSNTTQYRGIARLNQDGSLDTSFVSNVGGQIGFNGPVNSIAIDNSGFIYAGGSFSSYTAFPFHNSLAKLDSSGVRQGTYNFTPGINGEVYKILPQNDNSMIVMGNFTSVANNVLYASPVTVGRIVKIFNNGIVDTGFNPCGNGANNPIFDACFYNSGILLAGSFNRYNNQIYSGVSLIKAVEPVQSSSSSSSNNVPVIPTNINDYIDFIYNIFYQRAPTTLEKQINISSLGGDTTLNLNNKSKLIMSMIGFDSNTNRISNRNVDYHTKSSPILRTFVRFKKYGIPNPTKTKYYEILNGQGLEFSQEDNSYVQFTGVSGPNTFNGRNATNLWGLTKRIIKSIDKLAIDLIPSQGSQPWKKLITPLGTIPSCSNPACNCGPNGIAPVGTHICFLALSYNDPSVTWNYRPGVGSMVADMQVSPGYDTSFFLPQWVTGNFPDHTYGAAFSVFHQYASNVIYDLPLGDTCGTIPCGVEQIRDFEHRLATAFLRFMLLNQWSSSFNSNNIISLAEVLNILTQFEASVQSSNVSSFVPIIPNFDGSSKTLFFPDSEIIPTACS